MDDPVRFLLVLRHGRARHDLPLRDADRPLAEQGRADMAKIGVEAARRGWLPECVLCSPAMRTRETAVVFTEAAGVAPEVRFDDLMYSGAAPDLLQMVRLMPPDVRRLMVVGHNPSLADLVAQLSGGEVRSLSAGSLVAFAVRAADWATLDAASVTVAGVLVPEP